MNLDVISGLCCGIIAACAFYLLSASSNEHKVWPNLPWWVQFFLLFTGCASTVRATDFLSIADQPARLGHINVWGILMSLSLTCLFGSFCWYVHRLALKNRGHERIRNMVEAMHKNPDILPVAMTSKEVLDTERALGWKVNDDILRKP